MDIFGYNRLEIIKKIIEESCIMDLLAEWREHEKKKSKTLAYRTIGCAMKVYSKLGPGLLESVYQKAMLIELEKQDIGAESEVPIEVTYDGVDLGLGFRMDILVEGILVLELKSVSAFESIHYKQLSNYLHLTNLPLGYLINFNVEDFAVGKGFEKVKNLRYQEDIPEWLYYN